MSTQLAWAWRRMPAIPVFRRPRQGHRRESEAGQGYVAKPCLKTKQNGTIKLSPDEGTPKCCLLENQEGQCGSTSISCPPHLQSWRLGALQQPVEGWGRGCTKLPSCLLLGVGQLVLGYPTGWQQQPPACSSDPFPTPELAEAPRALSLANGGEFRWRPNLTSTSESF